MMCGGSNRNGLTIYLLLLACLTTFGGRSFTISESGESRLLGDESTFFLDRTDSLDLDDILKLEFHPVEKAVYSSPASTGSLWMKFSGSSQFNEDLWMDVHNSNLTQVDVYKFDEFGQLLNEYHSGVHFGNDQHRLRNTFYFPLIDRSDRGQYTFFVRAKTHLALELPIYIGSQTALHVNSTSDDLMAIFFVGSLAVLMLYNIFFFFNLRKKIYLYYSLNCLAFIVAGPYFNNFPLMEYIAGSQFAHEYTFTWSWITLFTGALFSIEYLDLRNTAPLIRKTLILIVGMYIAAIPVAFLSPSVYLVQFYLVSTGVFYLICLGTGYYLLVKKKSRKALLYSIGWTALVMGIIVLILVRNGYLPFSIYIRNSSYYGAFIEAIVFAIAIGQYMNEMRVEQAKLNEKLRRSNRVLVDLNESLDSFNYHVSHDLKTVLNNSNSLSRMIEKYNEKGDQTKIGEIVSKLKKVTENGAETVQSFLSLGRVDSIMQNDATQRISIRTEIDEILSRHDLHDRIAVSIDSDQIGTLEIHQKAFESIFLNLFTNSIKYCNQEPKAKINFLKKGKMYLFEYTDNGIGIDLDQYGDQLFKPFQRPTTSEQQEGTGVGLYLIKRILDGYGGDISVVSQLGVGTTFTITLPQD